jgi:hypothetical protein
MPIPIKMLNDSLFDGKLNDKSDMSFLESICKEVVVASFYHNGNYISDADADLLYSLWDKSNLAKNAANVEGKLYYVPKEIDDSSLKRLAKSGLLTIGASNCFSFTKSAAEVIKTFVLSEKNNFEKKAVKKPFSIILAESKSKKRKSNLAMASKYVDNESQKINKEARNNPIGKKAPNENQKWFYNKRLICTEGGSRKEYNVVIYISENGKFELWAFNGKIGNTLTPQPKGLFNSRFQAEAAAADLEYMKKSKRGYIDADEAGYNPVRRDLIGSKMSSTEANSYAASLSQAPDNPSQPNVSRPSPRRTTQAPPPSPPPPPKKTYTSQEIQENYGGVTTIHGLAESGWHVDANDNMYWKPYNILGMPISEEKYDSPDEAIEKLKQEYSDEVKSTLLVDISDDDSKGVFILKRGTKMIGYFNSKDVTLKAAIDYIKSLGKTPEELGWYDNPPCPIPSPTSQMDESDVDFEFMPQDIENFVNIIPKNKAPKLSKNIYDKEVIKLNGIFPSDMKSILNRKMM